MTDLLERYSSPKPLGAKLAPIPWSEDLAPTPVKHHSAPNASLPKADFLVFVYTSAESQAQADTLSPGVSSENWQRYTKNWSKFEKHLTSQSPARYSRCLASYQLITIGSARVILAKSDLHLCTDDQTVPVKTLVQQMAEDCQPSLVIDSGTAGGTGPDVVEGDVLITDTCQFNCTQDFKDAPFAHQKFVSESFVPGPNVALAQSTLMTVNAPKLRPIATRDPVIWTNGDDQTVDFFAFSDAQDTYGLLKADPLTRMEEMDCGAMCLGLSEMSSPPWLSVRNASDPMVPTMATLAEESAWAQKVYDELGYYTTIGSAIACWAVIADTLGAT